jgi:hypothetical protein
MLLGEQIADASHRQSGLSSYPRHIEALGASHATPFAEVVHRGRPSFLGMFAPRESTPHAFDGLFPIAQICARSDARRHARDVVTLSA